MSNPPSSPSTATHALGRLAQTWGAWSDGLWQWLWQPMPYSTWPWAAVLGLVTVIAVVLAGTATVAVPWARRWWTDETPRPGEDEQGVSTEELSLQEHLLELRNRLIKALIALAVTTAAAFVFYPRWFDIAVWPIRGRGNCAAVAAYNASAPGPAVNVPVCLQAITPTELIFAYFQLALVVGVLVAMPVIAYQLWAYVAPGLTRKERRYVLAVVPGATLSFLVGVLFAYFALLPAALGFLLGFSTEVEIRPTVASYIAFLSHLLLAIGVIFQLPLAMFFLSKVHLLTPRLLSSARRYVIVLAFVVAAVVTPTPDPFNQALVAIPILVLYELGVLLARLA